ncbi:hypothetical protein LINGRAHAP2_LOCUS29502 [Linum grandiflorum]
MSDPYQRAKAGRLAFKGGDVAVTSKAISKKKKKAKKQQHAAELNDGGDGKERMEGDGGGAAAAGGGEGASDGAELVYTIDAAKKKKYEDLFPVEAKKFGYDPKAKEKKVEEALDDRVKKKADRYCK